MADCHEIFCWSYDSYENTLQWATLIAWGSEGGGGQNFISVPLQAIAPRLEKLLCFNPTYFTPLVYRTLAFHTALKLVLHISLLTSL